MRNALAGFVGHNVDRRQWAESGPSASAGKGRTPPNRDINRETTLGSIGCCKVLYLVEDVALDFLLQEGRKMGTRVAQRFGADHHGRW